MHVHMHIHFTMEWNGLGCGRFHDKTQPEGTSPSRHGRPKGLSRNVIAPLSLARPCVGTTLVSYNQKSLEHDTQLPLARHFDNSALP
jgi:hypothetical protein